MGYSVEIRNNHTGETKIVEMGLDWRDSSIHWWTKGNFSCDCNREGVWGSNADVECGNKYTVLKAILEDGTEILLDEVPA